MYHESEKQLFEVKAKEHAAKLAEDNINCFFGSCDEETFHTQHSADWQAISRVFAFDPEQHYSAMHKHISGKKKSDSTGATEGDNLSIWLRPEENSEVLQWNVLILQGNISIAASSKSSNSWATDYLWLLTRIAFYNTLASLALTC